MLGEYWRKHSRMIKSLIFISNGSFLLLIVLLFMKDLEKIGRKMLQTWPEVPREDNRTPGNGLECQNLRGGKLLILLKFNTSLSFGSRTWTSTCQLNGSCPVSGHLIYHLLISAHQTSHKITSKPRRKGREGIDQPKDI